MLMLSRLRIVVKFDYDWRQLLDPTSRALNDEICPSYRFAHIRFDDLLLEVDTFNYSGFSLRLFF